MKTPLQENHQIILTLTARDGSPVEWSFTTGTPIFTATMEEQGIHFSGTLESVTGNTAILIYSLTWETPVPCATNTLYKKSSLQGGVRIELGKGVVLFRAGKQRVQVSVLPLEPGTP